VSPRQLSRLRATRTSGTYDDQKTPAEILQAETLSEDLEQLLDYVLSQLRRVLGTADWKDAVPASLAALLSGLGELDSDLVDGTCADTDAVGDFVYLSGNPFGGRYQVDKVDVTDETMVPAWGVIVEKSAPAECRVRYRGIVDGAYTGLTPGVTYYIGTDGRPTANLASIPSRGFRQPAGLALSSTALLLDTSRVMVRLA
jgi:hypothetical protein